MINLRETAMRDARVLNTQDWGQSVEMIAPDGALYNTDAITGDALRAVHVSTDYTGVSPTTGEEMRVKAPVVVLSRASLSRIPANGESWLIKVPPEPGADPVWYSFSETRAKEGGQSLGLVQLYLQATEQSEAAT